MCLGGENICQIEPIIMKSKKVNHLIIVKVQDQNITESMRAMLKVMEKRTHMLKL